MKSLKITLGYVTFIQTQISTGNFNKTQHYISPRITTTTSWSLEKSYHQNPVYVDSLY